MKLKIAKIGFWVFVVGSLCFAGVKVATEPATTPSPVSTYSPAPMPTVTPGPISSVDVDAPNINRPNRCKRKWYC